MIHMYVVVSCNLKMLYCILSGVKHIVGNGKSINFWLDVWIDNCPFKIRFDNLFRICGNPSVRVDECFVDGIWNIDFVRSFGAKERDQWEELKSILNEVSLTDDNDSIEWCLDKHGQFSVKSLYRHITFGGVVNWKLQKVWDINIPLKVKIFL